MQGTDFEIEAGCNGTHGIRSDEDTINTESALGQVSWVPVNPWISRTSSTEPMDF